MLVALLALGVAGAASADTAVAVDAAAVLTPSASSAAASSWQDWITGLGHDTYSYPEWINAQIQTCHCHFNAPVESSRPHAARDVQCTDARGRVDWRADVARGVSALSFCTSKLWLLEHMPEFDLSFLPGSVSVNGTSMLEDHIAFALMADRAAPWSSRLPLATKLSYLLPYASYHESRQNWRPLLFAKFFAVVANATSAREAMERLIAPNVFTDWESHYWPSSPVQPPSRRAEGGAGEKARPLAWGSSSTPPVSSVFDFVAYGYGSCTAWSTLLAYTARAVGIPARQAGTPCWNSIYMGVDFRGLAASNPNVSLCWRGGSDARGHGAGWLNNHQWVEYFDPALPPSPDDAGAGGGAAEAGGAWAYVNVPPQTKAADAGLPDCDDFGAGHGCGYNASAAPGEECDGVVGGPGAAMRDHEIFAVSWSEPSGDAAAEGGPVIDAAALTLSDGSAPSVLVWSPSLSSPLGTPLRSVGLRLVNRTGAYRCRPGRRLVSK